MAILRSSRIVTLDKRKDVLLGQLVWILGLLGVTHMEAISPLPEESAVVAGTEKGRGQSVLCLGGTGPTDTPTPGNCDFKDGCF